MFWQHRSSAVTPLLPEIFGAWPRIAWQDIGLARMLPRSAALKTPSRRQTPHCLTIGPIFLRVKGTSFAPCDTAGFEPADGATLRRCRLLATTPHVAKP